MTAKYGVRMPFRVGFNGHRDPVHSRLAASLQGGGYGSASAFRPLIEAARRQDGDHGSIKMALIPVRGVLLTWDGN